MNVRKLAAITVILLLGTTCGWSATNASVTIQVTTEPTKGPYSPRHVYAMWIVDAKGNHVRTLELHARKYRKYLTEWRKDFGKKDDEMPVDAITGASLKEHKTHEVTWDCRDEDGKTVPNGTYEVVIEFSEENGSGPVFRAKFDVGRKATAVSPREKKNFKDVKITFKPPDGVAAAKEEPSKAGTAGNSR